MLRGLLAYFQIGDCVYERYAESGLVFEAGYQPRDSQGLDTGRHMLLDSFCIFIGNPDGRHACESTMDKGSC